MVAMMMGGCGDCGMGGCGCGGFFFFFWLVSCGMGGRFVVVVVWVVGFWWVVGFVVIVGIVVVNGVENSWVEEKERDRGERDREIEEE